MTVHIKEQRVHLQPDILDLFAQALFASIQPWEECEMSFVSRIPDPHPGSRDELVIRGSMRARCSDRYQRNPLATPADIGRNRLGETLRLFARIIPADSHPSFTEQWTSRLPDGRMCTMSVQGSVTRIESEISNESEENVEQPAYEFAA